MTKPVHTAVFTLSNTTLGNQTNINPYATAHRVVTDNTYECLMEMKSMMMSMAEDEDVPEGYRHQIRRLLARMVMEKL